MTVKKEVLLRCRPVQTPLALVAKRNARKHTARPSVAGRKSSRDATNRLSVGLWDLGAWLGSVLPRLIRRMNRAQDAFRFFEVRAPIPSGMIRPAEGIVEWLRSVTGLHSACQVHWTKRQRSIIVFEDFRILANSVRKDMGIDYLVGISPSMVAGVHGSEAYWDYFSQSKGRLILASTYDLRDFSMRTHWPFEAYLAAVIVAELLRACSPGLYSHDDCGCLFDFNEERTGFMATLEKLHIESKCLKKVNPRCRSAALALIESIRNLKVKTRKCTT